MFMSNKKNVLDAARFYYSQKAKVEKEKRVLKLLFKDYVEEINCNVSRYDYLTSLITDAQNELHTRKKKNINSLKSFISEDFCNGEPITIKDIVQCGLENYAWLITFELYGVVLQLDIPVVANINVDNVEYAHYGMFALLEHKGNNCWSTLAEDYEISGISKFIAKTYLEKELQNENKM